MTIHVRRRMSHSLTGARLQLEVRRSAGAALVLVIGIVAAIASMGDIFGHIHLVLPWQSQETYEIAVPDATSVEPGQDEVRISGLRVGAITGSRLDGDQAVLTLSIDPKYGRLYRNAQLRLRPQTPLEDMYVDIVNRGTPSAGALGPHTLLPARQVGGTVDIGHALDAFNADTRASMQTLIDQLGRGLAGNGEQLKSAFVELFPFMRAATRLTSQISTRQTMTATLVHNLRLLTSALGQRDGQLAGLVQYGNRTLVQLAHNSGSLSSTLEQLPPTLSTLQTTLNTVRGTLSALNPALIALRPTASQLRSGLINLRTVSDRAAPILGALGRPIQTLEPLARDLVPTSASLRSAVNELTPLAPELNRITQQAVPCELAIQKFFQWTPSVFKFSDAHGIFPRGEGVAGTEAAGGFIHDPNLTIQPGCTN
jgi:ABC-type transporter Mla subunit MlaD